jgi:hypothetical protein
MGRKKEEILNGMSRMKFDLLCCTDFKFFCERMLGLTDMGGIHDFQLKWIELIEDNKIIIIEAPSGSSKTEIVGACYPLWKMYQNPDKKLDLKHISKTIGQSEKNLLIRIQNYILDNEILMESLVPPDRRVSWTKTGFRTINGTTDDIITYGVNAKGTRGHFLFCDEIDSYEDPDIFFKHILSRPHPNGKIIGITTPEGVSNIVGQLKEKKPRGVVFHKTVVFVHKDGSPVTSDEVQTIEDFDRLKELGCESIWEENDNFTFETMKDKFSTMGRLAWIQNYLCEILGISEDMAFPLKDIVDSYDYELEYTYEVNPKALYFIGADFATSSGSKADYDAFVVIELYNNVYTLKMIKIGHGIHPEVKVKELRRLYDNYSKGLNCIVIADESNAGSVLIKMIRAGGMTVVPQKFNGVARWDLLQTLSNVLKSGYIKIPKNQKQEDFNKLVNTLQEQLCGFQRTKTEKGNETFLSKARHDDIAISLAMAIKEASKHMTTYVKPVSA